MSKYEEIRKRATERMVYDAKQRGWSDTSDLTNDVFYLLGEAERLRQVALDALGCMITMSAVDNDHVKRISESLREEEA